MSVRLIVACVAAALAGGVEPAVASELIARNAKGVKLEVDDQARALVTYRAAGRTWRVLVWGAVNAVAPDPSARQVKFRLDYSGGRQSSGTPVWKTFQDGCRAYDGPVLTWRVATCKAPDGSYWALQSWQRALPNYGVKPTREQAVWELRLSHWDGELPQLEVKLDWAYRRFDHLYGRFTYRGEGVYGFRATKTGVPLDTFGRNVYVDTYNSAYGPGWKRENSFLTHSGSGQFCYGFYRHGQRPSGMGERYRATIIGPGVTPDAYWYAEAPGPFDRARDLAANEEQRSMFRDSPLCRPN